MRVVGWVLSGIGFVLVLIVALWARVIGFTTDQGIVLIVLGLMAVVLLAVGQALRIAGSRAERGTNARSRGLTGAQMLEALPDARPRRTRFAVLDDAPGASSPRRSRPFRLGVGKWGLGVYAILAFAFLLVPIVYTIAFSFNDVRRSNIAWRGFTLENWINVCNQQEVCEAFGNSILVALTATLLATALGTAMAIALVRYRFRFRNATTLLLFLPMATPEVVLGAGLAAQFLAAGVAKGLLTIILAHTMFCISFVVVTVRARVASLDPALEEAGRDLYASPAQVFWRITFPLLLPGIVAAALLSFALSFDDFIITNFNAGAAVTFPKYVYTAASRGIPAEANVVASAVFLVAIVGVIIAQVAAGARRKRLARAG